MNRTERRFKNMTDMERLRLERKLKAIDKGMKTLKMKIDSAIQEEGMAPEDFKKMTEKPKFDCVNEPKLCTCADKCSIKEVNCSIKEIIKQVETEQNAVFVDLVVKVAPIKKDGTPSKAVRNISVKDKI